MHIEGKKIFGGKVTSPPLSLPYPPPIPRGSEGEGWEGQYV